MIYNLQRWRPSLFLRLSFLSPNPSQCKITLNIVLAVAPFLLCSAQTPKTVSGSTARRNFVTVPTTGTVWRLWMYVGTNAQLLILFAWRFVSQCRAIQQSTYIGNAFSIMTVWTRSKVVRLSNGDSSAGAQNYHLDRKSES